MKNFVISVASVLLLAFSACERVDIGQDNLPVKANSVTPEAMARLLSALPIGVEQICEVRDAVGMSSGNGYDDEYMMVDLLSRPGVGVGGQPSSCPSSAQASQDNILTKSYSRPLRDLLREELESRTATKSPMPGISVAKARSEGLSDVEAVLEAIGDSDLQIYWPYEQEWDERSLPTITFDPEDNSETNIGWEICIDQSGQRSLVQVVVDEEYAQNHPVWVVNRNDDSGYTTLEMLRREDPDWGSGGGTIIVHPHDRKSSGTDRARSLDHGQMAGLTKSSGAGQSLILHSFKALRNYDCWFAGASEFWVKAGAVEDFVASTEAELKLYNPTITDFMVIVKRNEVGMNKVLDAMLVSDWKEQLQSCALMITEDDGGTRTTWNCSATVKIQSKSYGFEISLPLKSSDDIVWRGQLAYKYLCSTAGLSGRYGDTELTFDLISY